MAIKRGPMFVMFNELRQMRVGKHKEAIAVLEVREDVKRGEQLILTKRDMMFLQTGIEFYERKRAQVKKSS